MNPQSLIRCSNSSMVRKEEMKYFWAGPYGVLVPREIKYVMAENMSGVWRRDETAEERQVRGGTELEEYYDVASKETRKQDFRENYLKKFTEFDGAHHVVKPEKNFWDGPYGVRVAIKVNFVCASDGYNTLYRNGSETELGLLDGGENLPNTEERWKARYAVKRGDHWYCLKEPCE